MDGQERELQGDQMSKQYVQHMSERFTAKTVYVGDCIVWCGSIATNGYGQFWLDGRMQQAHRVAYEWHFGKIGEGLQLDHLCRNRACVNVGHLRPVTNRENQLAPGCLSPISINHARTECAQGHSFTEANTIWLNKGTRICRVCRNAVQRIGDRRRRAQRG